MSLPLREVEDPGLLIGFDVVVLLDDGGGVAFSRDIREDNVAMWVEICEAARV